MDTHLDKSSFNSAFMLSNIIFYALLTGQLFILAIFWFLTTERSSDTAEMDTIFTFIVPAVGLISMFLSRFIYSQGILKLNQNESIMSKLNKYRTLKIISWAILEGGALFALVAFFLTANYLYVAVVIFILGFFIFSRPSKEGFVMDMQITGPEKETILRS